jgi:hypothetical protein
MAGYRLAEQFGGTGVGGTPEGTPAGERSTPYIPALPRPASWTL